MARTRGRVSKSRVSAKDQLLSFLRLHLAEAKRSAQRIRDSGSASFLTALVIAISLALPSSLYLLLNNVEGLVNNWDEQSNISVFLKKDFKESALLAFEKRIQEWDLVKGTRYISAEQALEEFRKSSGLEDIIETLDTNPLPATIIIVPHDSSVSVLEDIERRLLALPEVEAVLIDTGWIARLNAMLALGKRFVMALAVALSIAVLLVIFNTIRLAIANRAEEILITKLVGATDAFVRRPFLYTGVWYGFVGGLLALVLSEILIILLQAPVIQLASLYQSSYSLKGVGILELFAIPALGLFIGLAGSWMAVSSHLRELIPE
jgi:cell division transport system permease protein